MTCREEPAVLAKRQDDRTDFASNGRPAEANLSLVSELLRNAAQQPEAKKPEEKISVFWRVFGGTILSITALVCIQAYQALNANIQELRSDQNRMREAAADYVKKDELSNRTTSLWNRVQDVQAVAANLSVAATKINALEQQLGGLDKERKETQAALVQLAGLKDRFTAVEEQKKLVEQDHKDILAAGTALQALRDRDSLLEKQLRDSEAERKDLQRELQVLRERLAKLEGAQQVPPGPGINKTVLR